MSESGKITVIIADDHLTTIMGMMDVLEFAEKIEVIDSDDVLMRAILKVKEKKPDVVIMDMNWDNDKNAGMEAIIKIRKQSPETRILAMTNYDNLFEKAKQAGADRILHKNFLQTKKDISDAIIDTYYSRLTPTLSEKEAPLPPIEPLSEREMEVLKLLCEGKTSKEIANILYIAEATVKNHRLSIYRKLDVHKIPEAMSRAIELNLIKSA